MTLFRKVFQNQSHPAAEEDLDDGAALRHAFDDAAADRGPLKLDPFDRVLADVSADDWSEQEEDDACEDPTTDNLANWDDSDHTDDNEGVDALSETGATDAIPDVSMDLSSGAFASDLPEASASEKAAETPLSDTAPGPQEEHAGGADDDFDSALVRALSESAPIEDNAQMSTEAPAAPALDVGKLVDEMQLTETHEDEAGQPAATEPQPAETDAAEEIQLDLSQAVTLPQSDAPLAGRAGRRSMRAKTRLLGFNRTGDEEHDPFGQAPSTTASAQCEKYPVGWLVIVEGPALGIPSACLPVRP